ncbi:LysR family transcriptional regulator [Pseudosulfitobacter koreensis]|uniref:LysR family transcriptional regulator n=1 Tax=Pseudosulfitobacter koreensis TaxID=2968472 RepID=A0ABT1Z4D7_9RHOB|nr:LysR family transcriptional regulator [Pseudosulfitobacter koreense]MCR8827997.1 LysR family transcriptional regulator [Pseudosulfitobacter koreense]
MADFVWDDLKHFMAVVAEGSVAGAARVAKIEHSTVTRRITRLETHMNVRLFNRLVRGWVLTDEGKTLHAQSVEIEHRMRNVERLSLAMGTVSGSVTLTAPPFLLSEIIMPALHGFHDAYPDISLRLLGEMKEANLSRGEADVALRMVAAEGAELVTQKICNVSYLFYGLPETCAVPAASRRFIGYSGSHQPYLSDAVLRQAAGRVVTVQTNNPRIAQQAALHGMGIALLPTFLAAQGPALQVIEPARLAISQPVYLVMQRDVRKAGRVRALTDYLRDNLSKGV